MSVASEWSERSERLVRERQRVRVTEGNGGSTEVNPGRSRGKGDSLFYMIPLERWNVERRVTFSSKSTKGCWHNIPVRAPIRLVASEVITTCHRPLERREEVNPTGSGGSGGHFVGTTNGGQWDSSGFTTFQP